MSKDKDSVLSNVKHDFPASIVVFLVAMPLCLGVALASGAPLFSGIISGVIGGVIVASLSGSSLGVSGPAAGLAVIVLHSIESLGSFESFLLAVVIAGVFQIVLGVLKAGVIGYYFPSSVIKGMLAGIGINIIIQQIPNALGVANFSSINITDICIGTTILTVVSVAILLFWDSKTVKENKYLKVVPGPLLVVAFGIIYEIVTVGDPVFGLKTDQLVAIPITNSFTGFMSNFSMPDFSMITNPEIYTIALTMAVVASLETLLSTEAADKLDPQKRRTPMNRELIAQGVGNMISGLIGGLPITQVIVRSSANIQSGGKTKLSAIMHGILLLICVVSIPAILDLIPLACLAAILLVVGFKLSKPAIYLAMYNKGWALFIPFIITILGVVFSDLLHGIVLGLAVSVFEIIWNNLNESCDVSIGEQENVDQNTPMRIELPHQVSFLNKANIISTLESIPHNTNVVIDATHNKTVHIDVLDIIEEFLKNDAIDKNISASINYPQIVAKV
ncbi:SulP family inorganic anion transporter [Flammeovirga pectinis]|uniref:SulP family inorganic anion transporter n=1 Tax=Flammeovirga pectinis TaxID=2494373 RepID=A0A3Q9FQC5_9BACT|nr:SulP family inorganic anion transporter [Flammeovirga pectinis]AZQ65142.1 SulP family inorganic anion transporter [Flammeovirga pectinis]